MDQASVVFILLGGAFLVGLAADAIGRRTRLPRVTMLLILGFLIGPVCLNFLPEGYERLFERASQIALTMVGFLLGEHLVHSIRSSDGKIVLFVSIAAVVVTAAFVFLGLWAVGIPVVAALLFAGIATATDPAATIDVIRQTGATGRFSKILLGVVAVDDAWGLLGFSVLLSVAGMLNGNSGIPWDPVFEGLWEIGGAVLIGGALGLVMAFVTGRITKGEPTLLEAIGFVFLACGLALAAEVSFILTAMVMGAVVARFAKHHEYPFHSIENIHIPFMTLFFLLAGASLDPAALLKIGWWGLAYIGFRMIGRVFGGWWGGRLAGTPVPIRRGIGLALMPQAGVALGMALLAQQKFPESGDLILQITIGSTVIFELTGPLITRFALIRAERIETESGDD